MEMVENGTIPFALFLLVNVVWALTVYQSHRLGKLFIAKYPEVASREIPYAFSHVAHPEKAIFFWRRRAAQLLRSDRELWKERQRFLYLSAASLLVPSIGFGGFFVYAFLHL
jgi:hypothetical protein